MRDQTGLAADAFGNVMTALIEQGRLVRLSDKVTYHSDSFRRAQEAVVAHISEAGSITVGELRDRLGLSRKYAVALLEHLDDAGVTVRKGDERVLAK